MSRDRPFLIGYDGRPRAHDALALGALLARATDSPVVVAWVYGPEPVLIGMEPSQDGRQDAVRELEEVKARLAEEGVTAEVRAITGESPAQALYELADDVTPRAIVVGSCHRGPIGRLLTGSTASRLLQGSAFPVVVAPAGYERRPSRELRTIDVAFDGRPDSWAALQHAAQIGLAVGARLRLVTAVSPLTGTPHEAVLYESLLEERIRRAEVELERACRTVSAKLEPESKVVAMDARWALQRESESDDVDMIVVGSRGYGPLRRVLAGSVSTALMNSAACPVMVVPRLGESDPSAEGMAAADELVARQAADAAASQR